jgi:hypothetical protein
MPFASTATDTEEQIREMEEDEAMTRDALDLLGSRRNDRYEASLAALREDTRDWWADTLARDPDALDEGEEPASADEAGLLRFLEGTAGTGRGLIRLAKSEPRAGILRCQGPMSGAPRSRRGRPWGSAR